MRVQRSTAPSTPPGPAGRVIDLQTDVTWRGTVSLEELAGGGVRPWRLPHDRQELFPPMVLVSRARMPAGVRVCLRTNTRHLRVLLDLDPLQLGLGAPSPLDVRVAGRRWGRYELDPGQEIVIPDLPGTPVDIELWLPHWGEVVVQRIEIDESADVSPTPPSGRRWITHGSSISQCMEAPGPLDTWPALVAQHLDLDLLCLGFGGQCLLDPMVARLIRDTPADFISLCLGSNVYGKDTHNDRSLLPALLGFIATVCEGHPRIPVAVISPISAKVPPDLENSQGLTLDQVRRRVEEATTILSADYDRLHFVNGYQIFGPSDHKHMATDFHPDADGYRMMGDRATRLLGALFRGSGAADMISAPDPRIRVE
jgi:hypothetical protein